MSNMEKITELLKKKFTISVELVPRRNCCEKKILLQQLEELKALDIDFLSVTKGAGGSLRGGTLPLAHFAFEHYQIPSIAHFTCREINKYEVENGLADQHYFGIKNILALRGDPPANAIDDHWTGDYSYAYQLVEQISRTNQGKYLARKGIDLEFRKGAKTDFCIGVAAHPNAPREQRLQYLLRKIDAGADFAITQMLFDPALYEELVADLRSAGKPIPVIPGIFAIDSKKKISIVEKDFGITLPKNLKVELNGLDEEGCKRIGVQRAVELCVELKNRGAPGIHFFVFQSTQLARELITALRAAL